MVESAKENIGAFESRVWQLAAGVADPEIPVVTLGDLGIVRDVKIDPHGIAIVKLTPTYSGCPAIQVIEENVAGVLHENNIKARVERVISPPWTTDWITHSGRQKLKEYGIAPPQNSSASKPQLFNVETPQCPKCDSTDTILISQFGSTPCKAHYQCENCMEPFDYFKCI